VRRAARIVPLTSVGKASARAAAASLLLVLYSIPTSAQNPPVSINVDASANRRPINPNVYGVAHATTAQLNDLNSPLNRNGGNTRRATTGS
jgi:hypothetical protein